MNIQVDPTSSNLASAMLNSKIRPRAVVGYGVKIFHPSPPNYVNRSPGVLWYLPKWPNPGGLIEDTNMAYVTSRENTLFAVSHILTSVKILPPQETLPLYFLYSTYSPFFLHLASHGLNIEYMFTIKKTMHVQFNNWIYSGVEVFPRRGGIP